jgi:hypothetical protein
MMANSAMATFRAVRLPTRWLPAGSSSGAAPERRRRPSRAMNAAMWLSQRAIHARSGAIRSQWRITPQSPSESVKANAWGEK